MKVHFTYKHSKTPALESLIELQVQKLRKRLQVFKPDMISLHGSLENGTKAGCCVSLNLRLPTGQMAARSAAETPAAAVRASFDDLVQQVTKHKAQLRAKHHWPRHRTPGSSAVSQVAFESTSAAVHAETISGSDITSYVIADLGRLRRFVERELQHLVSAGRLRHGQLSSEEVIDEAVASALDDSTERPEKLALEPWMYRVARQAIARLSNDINGRDGWVSIESSDQGARKTPDEVEPEDGVEAGMLTRSEVAPNGDLIIDDINGSPEDQAANDEMVGMVDLALRDAKPEERDAFVLYVFEGFTLQEIAAITDRSTGEIQRSILRARERVSRSIPVEDRLKTSILTRAEAV
jgi:RNA polymerase sigma factor (sigma-70 family)